MVATEEVVFVGPSGRRAEVSMREVIREKKMNKQKAWEGMMKKLDKMGDGLGRGLDEGIKETVAALNLLGINTRQSCEGHLTRGIMAPWVDFEASKESVGDLEKRMQEAFGQAEKRRERIGEEDEEVTALYKRHHGLRRELKIKNLANVANLTGFLEEFYANRDVGFMGRLVLDVIGTGNSRLQSQGAEFQETLSIEERKVKLLSYQEEMAAFTEFLKRKFFEV